MNLIPISPNVLINPEHISCVEQDVIGQTAITYVYVGDKKFILGMKLKDFYDSLGIASQSSGKQHFAG